MLYLYQKLKITLAKERTHKMTKEKAKEILNYLKEKNMSFCFIINGELIDRNDCRKVLQIELDKTIYE